MYNLSKSFRIHKNVEIGAKFRLRRVSCKKNMYEQKSQSSPNIHHSFEKYMYARKDEKRIETVRL